MSKPVFDPTQPFESSKPAFDPNRPFQSEDQSQPPAQEDAIASQVALEAAKTAVLGPYSSTKAMVDNPEEVRKQLPLVGAVGGEMLAGPAGASIGAGLGQIGKRVVGMAYGTEPLSISKIPSITDPSTWLNKESVGPMVQSIVAGLSGTTEGQAVTKTFQTGYAKAAETVSGLKKDITQTAFRKGFGAYNAPSLPKAQAIFASAVGAEGQAAMKETATEAFDPVLGKARQTAIEIGTKIENGQPVSAIEALQARQATDRIISATSWKDKMARNSLYGWRNRFDNELSSQSGKLANASRTYRSAIVKDKLLTATRMNKSGEPSALLPMILGAAGPIAGFSGGHGVAGTEAAIGGLVATSPAVWGLGAATMGAISPAFRQAILSEFIDRFVSPDRSGETMRIEPRR